jgi:hypothetical protein
MAPALDDDHDLENPAYYGVNSANTETQELEEEYSFMMEIEKSMNLVQTPGIPDGYAAQCHPRRVQIVLPFPAHIFEVDPKILPWDGYVFDLPAFGFWLYRCASDSPVLRDIDPALSFYRCLYYLGENELKGKRMIQEGDTNQDLRSWLDQCSSFAQLLVQRVELSYGRVPPGGTDTYPGFLIADYFFGPLSLSWITRYIRMIVRSNRTFTRNFAQDSRNLNTANSRIEVSMLCGRQLQ